MAYIINPHGILHTIPDTWPLPKGSRFATKDEVAAWQQADAAQRRQSLAEKRERARQRAQLVVMQPLEDVELPAAQSDGEKGKKENGK